MKTSLFLSRFVALVLILTVSATPVLARAGVSVSLGARPRLIVPSVRPDASTTGAFENYRRQIALEDASSAPQPLASPRHGGGQGQGGGAGMSEIAIVGIVLGAMVVGGLVLGIVVSEAYAE